ncbi:hypothetical protein BO71DRAFT_409703 [Aspergillus ellipticus CBS 707.79]|uniref:Helicase C-terminal domain-containing protein n=1 Tax=Aspergillus ellipticus CBS 707.79 TaxID=1448320 RepID=A0A319D9X2_9EURO|nr:hypothetical protein BO71DRAFT_409703 [Aspergillus ellipticus CBS 707.79]
MGFTASIKAIGRVHRVGQKEPQKVWTFFSQNTVSRWMKANNAARIAPQICADIRPNIDDEVRKYVERRAGPLMPWPYREQQALGIEDRLMHFNRIGGLLHSDNIAGVHNSERHPMFLLTGIGIGSSGMQWAVSMISTVATEK